MMMFYYGDIGLEVPENVYCPQEDSLLIAKTVEIAGLAGKKCLDMGCGSGFLSILMAKEGAIVTSADINKDAVASTIRNTEMNNANILKKRSFLEFSKSKGFRNLGETPSLRRSRRSFASPKMNIVQSDLFEKIVGRFDLIVFNPPYLPVDDKYTHESYDGGKTGREIIGRFLEGAKDHLTAKGNIILLISSLTGEKEVIEFAESCGFTPEVLERQKIDWEELIVLGLQG